MKEKLIDNQDKIVRVWQFALLVAAVISLFAGIRIKSLYMMYNGSAALVIIGLLEYIKNYEDEEDNEVDEIRIEVKEEPSVLIPPQLLEFDSAFNEDRSPHLTELSISQLSKLETARPGAAIIWTPEPHILDNSDIVSKLKEVVTHETTRILVLYSDDIPLINHKEAKRWLSYCHQHDLINNTRRFKVRGSEQFFEETELALSLRFRKITKDNK